MTVSGGPHSLFYLHGGHAAVAHHAIQIQQRSPLHRYVEGIAAQLSGEFRQDQFDPMRRLITVGDDVLGGGPTGSGSNVITMGIVEVASLAARVAGGPPVIMMSTL